MTDENSEPTVLDELAEETLEEMGLCLDSPRERFTLDAGLEFSRRLCSRIPAEQGVFEDLLIDVVVEFAENFPKDPDSETIEFQSYFLGPLVSLLLTGRGLTLPEMAEIARVSSEHTYRLNRKGLSILFREKDDPGRTGVNRRFSGRDERKKRLIVDLHDVGSKPWTGRISEYQPFVVGVLEGLRGWLELPTHRAQLEPRLRAAFADLLSDPSLGDVLDGVVLALHRISQDLRGHVFKMQADKEKALGFERLLVELTNHRSEVLSTLAKAGETIRADTKVLRGRGGP